ncbi:hypothetical protein H7R52_12000 [Weissella confusa]|uniref:Uncharacterized protein n=1 Tax=Weissella confusa TaxID=1583 RepID=A0A923SNQ0_WEICO|nr:hypothetical protein [Weissella confusa]
MFLKETPAVVTQALYGTTPIYQSGGYPVIVPGVLPYTGYESGAWVSPVLAQSWPYQATAPRTLAGETNGRESSSVSDDPAVQAAMQRLQEIIVAAALDDPDNLTADILAAMQALQSAVAKAEAEQAATVSVTTQTRIADAKPVSNEKSVADAIKQLQTVLNDPNATRTAIEQAMTKLQNATESAKESRENANSQAQQAIQAALDQAAQSDLANDPTVVAAMDTLRNAMTTAATDTSDALTADIKAAMQALQDAMTALVDDAREQAQQAAADALTKTAPVSHEPATAAAIDALNALVNDPNANYADIKQATEDLLNQVATDTQERDATTTDGNALRRLPMCRLRWRASHKLRKRSLICNV